MTPEIDGSFVRACGSGEVIFREGDPGDVFYIVIEGSVSIRQTGTDEDSEVAILREGDFFGEMAVVDEQPRSATAVARGPVTLLSIDAARFVYLVAQQPGFAMLIMETMSARQRGRGAIAGRGRLPEPQASGAYRVVEVARDCYQLRALSRASNAYVFRGSERVILIDTGLPSSAEGLHAALGTIGLQPSDIDLIVLTHEHFDHTGGVPSFGGKPEVAALGLAANKIRLGDDFATMQRGFGEAAEPFSIDLDLAPGMILDTGKRRLAVHHTPGHSSGGLSLIDQRDGLLISGDTVLAGGPIGGVFGSGNISDLIYSLDQLAALRPTMLLPGHGRVSEEPLRDIALTRDRCVHLLNDTRTLFDVLDANRKVNLIVNAFRDLNRSYAQ